MNVLKSLVPIKRGNTFCTSFESNSGFLKPIQFVINFEVIIIYTI